jgi:hypothetical protein
MIWFRDRIHAFEFQCLVFLGIVNLTWFIWNWFHAFLVHGPYVACNPTKWKSICELEAINSFCKGVSSCQLYLELHNINNVKTLMTFSSIILAIGQWFHGFLFGVCINLFLLDEISPKLKIQNFQESDFGSFQSPKVKNNNNNNH